MGVGSGEQGGTVAPWIFIHSTNTVDKSLIVLFFGLFFSLVHGNNETVCDLCQNNVNIHMVMLPGMRWYYLLLCDELNNIRCCSLIAITFLKVTKVLKPFLPSAPS